MIIPELYNIILLKTGSVDNAIIFSRVFISLVLMGYINNSLHLARKYAQIFVLGHHLFRETNSFA